MITITRALEFDAGHRIVGHESKCAYLHGHRYKIEVTISNQDDRDSLGRVLDFGVIKNILKAWIDSRWDHNTIFFKEDPFILFLTQGMDLTMPGDKKITISTDNLWKRLFAGRMPYVMESNPTAENLITEFHNQTIMLLPDGIFYEHIRLYETPTCWADLDCSDETRRIRERHAQ